MVNTLKTILLILFVIAGQVSFGQTDKEQALSKAQEAIKLMDSGKIDESIKLLKEAQRLDPERFDYHYEMAYAYYAKADYKGAAKILEKNKSHENVTATLYQLLGNCYDILGDRDKAFEVYDAGLKTFPNAGMIYLEKGNMYLANKEYAKALPFYEKGIEVDPKFPSNYYRATLIYCNSTEEVWGMIYGEIFINLERNTARTSEISQLLFDTYKSEIKLTSDSSFSVSFCANATISLDNLNDPSNFKLPYGMMVYEPTLMFSMLSVKSINLESLNSIRSTFIDNYFKNGNDVRYPNVLFSYQKQVKDAGHIEAYNYWVLLRGDENGFTKWHEENKQKWDDFIDWFTNNGLQINESTKFYSGQY